VANLILQLKKNLFSCRDK